MLLKWTSLDFKAIYNCDYSEFPRIYGRWGNADNTAVGRTRDEDIYHAFKNVHFYNRHTTK
jgi:hypothetical protein